MPLRACNHFASGNIRPYYEWSEAAIASNCQFGRAVMAASLITGRRERPSLSVKAQSESQRDSERVLRTISGGRSYIADDQQLLKINDRRNKKLSGKEGGGKREGLGAPECAANVCAARSRGSRLRRGEDRKEARLVSSALHPLRRSPRLLSGFLGS